jgi:putative redox protein
MAVVELKWTGGQQYVGADAAGHVVVMDMNGQGMKASEMFLIALVGCAGADVVTILQKKRQKFSAIEAKVNRENAPDPPWTIEKIEIDWTVRGRDLKEKAVEDAIHLAVEKYCSVAASLTSEIVLTVHAVNDAEDG